MQGPGVLDLTHDEWRAYIRALSRTHRRRITLEVLDLDGDPITTMAPMILDGQLVVDATASDDQPTRILTISFLDPKQRIGFEPDSVTDTPLHRRRMLRVTHAIRVPEINRWVGCRIFTGPIWDFDRDGATVNIVAHGKERQSLGNIWTQLSFPAKTRKTTIIRRLLAATGETRFAIPDAKTTSPKRFTVLRMDQPWVKARHLAKSMDRRLFYDGRGVATLRAHSNRPVFTIGRAFQLSDVRLDRNPDGIFNIFLFTGGKPKGQKKKVQSKAWVLPKWHDLSPWQLRRNQVPQRLVRHEENDQVKTAAEANRRAKRLRDDAARTTVDCSIDTLPIPFLDEGDLVRVPTNRGVFLLRADKWTLPLGVEGAPVMTLGAIRRTTQGHRGHHGKDRRRGIGRNITVATGRAS